MTTFQTMQAEVKGRFKFLVRKGDEVVRESEWTDNLVLDNGLRNLGDKNVMAYCRVGSGSSEPTVSQMTLDNQIASSSSPPPTEPNQTTGVDAVDEFFWARRVYRFGTGVAAGRLSEVGIGWASTGETLFNRALLRDAKGHKVTVTVLEDETLDVIVELKSYISSTPVTGQLIAITTSQEGTSVQTDYQVSITPYYSAIRANSAFYGVSLPDNACIRGYSGPSVSTTSEPSGYIATFNQTTQPYTEHFKRVFEGYWGINEGNGAPLKTVVLHTSIGQFQVELTPTFPKVPQYVLRLGIEVSWSRYE